MVLTLLLSPAWGSERPTIPSWRPLIELLPCSATIERELADWRTGSEVFRAPPGLDGRPVYRIPTARLGAWVTLVLAPEGGGGSRLYHSDWQRTVTVELDESCRARRSESSSLQSDGRDRSAFTDRDLASFLARSPRSLVYLWSPHLPLSVEGYEQASRAAEARGLGFVALVHPSADGDFVERAADDAGIPTAARRRLASVELLFRDLAVHAPSLLVFVDGHAESPLPGYRSAAGYLEYLDALLAEPTREGPRTAPLR